MELEDSPISYRNVARELASAAITRYYFDRGGGRVVCNHCHTSVENRSIPTGNLIEAHTPDCIVGKFRQSEGLTDYYVRGYT